MHRLRWGSAGAWKCCWEPAPNQDGTIWAQRPCLVAPNAVPKLFFFRSQMDPCGLFINCQKLQEMSGYQ